MKSRKLFAALLCALLCLLMADVALAADESPFIASGDCGDNGNNVTWKLTEDGTLTISGNGAMRDFYYYSSVPWYS